MVPGADLLRSPDVHLLQLSPDPHAVLLLSFVHRQRLLAHALHAAQAVVRLLLRRNISAQQGYGGGGPGPAAFAMCGR